jgi:hypothetical protein
MFLFFSLHFGFGKALKQLITTVSYIRNNVSWWVRDE